MAIWHINGGNRLEGSCRVQGSKNAVLPMLAASLITASETELLNVPQLSDVSASLEILRHLGCKAEQRFNDVYIDSHEISETAVPEKMMRSMRSSVLFMGALLVRCGEARICTPGGCNIGKRPIDMHLDVMRSLGAEVIQTGDEIVCRASKLTGNRIVLPFASVGATESAMLAACGAEGKTEIIGAAREPEIIDLQEYLRKLGAYIYGAGTDKIVIDGFSPEKHVGHRVIPDRIAASTLLCAVAAAGGKLELTGVYPKHFSQIPHFLNAAGCDIITQITALTLQSDGILKGVGEVTTLPYPGFPTDAQPLLMAALLKSRGETVFTETIFENRFGHVREMEKMGADISVSGNCAVLHGVKKMHGAKLTSSDLRGGAALVLAGLCAGGNTEIYDDGFIGRGYDRLDLTLRSLGADISMEM